jgi:hypothetical protein
MGPVHRPAVLRKAQQRRQAVDPRSRDLTGIEVPAMRTASENFVAVGRRECTRPVRRAVRKSA